MANKKSKEETDVILVVKGAGEQAEDDHLNIFLRGFWPAVKSLDAKATIAQITDNLEDYEPSPHNQDGGSHKHITEIKANYQGRNRRIWVKESYWEYEVLSSTALGNLSKEWHLSSFVFADMFRDLFFMRNTQQLKDLRTTTRQEIKYPAPRRWDYFGNYVSYLILFLLIFLPVGMATLIGENHLRDTLNKILPSTITTALQRFDGLYGLGFTLVVAAIWAIAPAVEISRITYLRYHRTIAGEKFDFTALPGLPGWALAVLIFLLVLDFKAYLLVLLLLLALVITQLVARRILWSYRKYANSDVDKADYYAYKTKDDEEHVGKVDEQGLTRFLFSPLFYRYFIYLVLPVGFLITVLASFLKWTKILGGLGEAFDGFVKFLLVGYMDDVVNYATDPAQAYRVRSVVMNDIETFHKIKDVKRIHVVAHSQGTPITFETLFQFLDTKYQKKIYTYVTLGSVLSYYYQARGILDVVYYNRFAMPIRQDKFPDEFKWMNFWNFTDPITEFYGLDEYTWFKKPPLDKPKDEMTNKDKKDAPKRDHTSPTNIRTRSSLSLNHGEYWSNIAKFQKPFAKRVLGEPRPGPDEWKPEQTSPQDWHHWGVFALWVVLITGSGLITYGLMTSGIMKPISDFFTDLWDKASILYKNLFPAPTEPSLLQRIWVNISLIAELWDKILYGSFIVLGVYAVLDWLAQLWRAFYRIGRKPKTRETT